MSSAVSLPPCYLHELFACLLQFHFLVNVAVGGLNGFIPDGVTNRGGAEPKPWTNNQDFGSATNDFWDARDDWYKWWADAGYMEVDYIRVYEQV